MNDFDWKNVPKVRELVRSILKSPQQWEWTLQGFGMLRTYLTLGMRLHVWDHGYRTKDVTDVHDHPWNFESLVVSGKIVNTRYRVHPCEHTDEQLAPFVRRPFLRSQIVCGVNGGNTPDEVKARGERVWLEPLAPEEYLVGQTYRQEASEVHHTAFGSGTVTLVRREFLQDTEHAHVFFRADEEWVSAEPRVATPTDVDRICSYALAQWRDP